MTLQRKSSPLFLMAMFTVMSVLLGAAASSVVRPSAPAFAQTSSSSLAQDIIDSAQQEETDQSSLSSAADNNAQTNTDNQEFDLDHEQEVEADVEQEADQAGGNLAVQEQEEEDTTPPTLIVPEEDITEEATSSDGAVVRFEVTAEDDVDGTAILDENNRQIQDDVEGSITISCDPPSGSTFPIGNTEVECTATDAAGNTATASFTVTVQDTTPPEEDGITIIDDQDNNSSCSPNGVEEHFFISYQFTGMPTPNSGWFLIYLKSSDGVETLIERAWSSGVMEDGSGGGNFGTSLDVGREPYTLTVYEADGPPQPGPLPDNFNPETDITIKEGGWSASVTFTCADLDPEV
jgi:hypothetical protein